MDEFEVFFPGGKKVAANYRGFTIETDQPLQGGGDNTAASPFELFLASLATCAGFYVLRLRTLKASSRMLASMS